MAVSGKFTFTWEATEVLDMKDTVDVFSPAHQFAGLSWKITLLTETSARTYNERVLHVHLFCHNDNSRRYWRCDHVSEVRLVNRMNATKTKTIRLYKPFSADLSRWGVATTGSYKWDEIMDSQEGYLDGEKLLFEAKIEVLNTIAVGISRPLFDFSKESLASDICLIVEGKKLFVSKGTLAGVSPTFEAMFYKDFKEKNAAELELQELDYEDFVAFLNAVKSTRAITDDTVESVLRMADRFNATSISDVAEDFLMTFSNIRMEKKLLLADQHRMEQLMGWCLHAFRIPQILGNIMGDELYRDFSMHLKSRIAERMMALS